MPNQPRRPSSWVKRSSHPDSHTSARGVQAPAARSSARNSRSWARSAAARGGRSAGGGTRAGSRTAVAVIEPSPSSLHPAVSGRAEQPLTVRSARPEWPRPRSRPGPRPGPSRVSAAARRGGVVRGRVAGVRREPGWLDHCRSRGVAWARLRSRGDRRRVRRITGDRRPGAGGVLDGRDHRLGTRGCAGYGCASRTGDRVGPAPITRGDHRPGTRRCTRRRVIIFRGRKGVEGLSQIFCDCPSTATSLTAIVRPAWYWRCAWSSPCT